MSVKISRLVDQWDYGGAADRDRFCPGRLPSGGTTPVFIVSSDTRVGGLRPWNLVEGSLADLVPGAVAIDQSYFDRLGTKGRAELDERDFGGIKIGQTVLVRSAAFRDREFAGKVLSISPIVQSSRISSRDQRNLTDVSVAEVVVDLAEPGPLAVGMKVDVYFRYDKPRQ
jgi:hypothetical protein